MYETTYTDMHGTTHAAYQIPWPDVTEILGHKHNGGPDDDNALIKHLQSIGAAEWVEDPADGWTDECGWLIVGPVA